MRLGQYNGLEKPTVIVKKWAVINNDLSVLTSDDFTPDPVLVDGVQWIVEGLCDGTRRYVHGLDYYRWTGDSWAGGGPKDLKRWILAYHPSSKWAREKWTLDDIVELEDWIRDEWPQVKLGLWISDEQYGQVREIATGLFNGR
jgi:hypothetical protein